MPEHAIVVDPIASGRFLADEFKTRGIDCIAVLSAPVPSNFESTYFPENFKKLIVFDGDFEALRARLSELKPVCVMAGLETGIELMDRLASKLGLPGNDPQTSLLRRDKFEMQAALSAKCLRSIRQGRVDSVEAAREWLPTHAARPIIVKPAASAGSDNVYLCHTLDESLSAVGEILGATNLLGQINRYALLQEYLEGREWVVDTVSCNGRHVVTNVARYLKLTTDCSRVIYRHSEFMSPAKDEFRELIEYATGVNDAVGVRYGAAHHEIIWTKGGPTLVEVNARMHGGDATKALRCCHPVSQLDLAVDAYIAPDAFAEKAKQPFRFSRHLIAHFLISESSGSVSSVASEATLRTIPSYMSASLPKVGASITKTVSLTTAPGYIWLVNEDEAALWRDQQLLMEMERDGRLYRLAGA
jgi:biotin carboxylase